MLILMGYIKIEELKEGKKKEDMEMDRKTIAQYPCHVL